MEATYTRSKLQMSRSMRIRGWLRFLFTLVVLVSVPVVLVLLFRTESAIRFNGVVESGSAKMGPTSASRLVSVNVKVGQQVKAGDVLVCFDSAEHQLEESLNELKIRDLEQRLVNRRDDFIEIERRCRENVRKAEVDYENEVMNRLRDEEELRANREELERIAPLIEKHLVSETEVAAIRTKTESLKNVVGGYEKMVGTLKTALESAREDLQAAVERRAKGEAEITAALESIRAAYERSEAFGRESPSVLRAVSDGVVTGVFHRPGDIVGASEAVVRVNSADGENIVTGMLPSGMQDAVRPGDEVWVTRQVVTPGALAHSVAAVVESVDAEVMDLFETSGDAAKTTVRGRKARIRITGDAAGFVPGESVTVSDAPLDGIGSFFRPGAK